MLTDEELAKIAYESVNISGVPWESAHISGNPLRNAKWFLIARALRQALTPAVAPLRPGETVTITDAWVPRDTLAVQSDVMQKDRRVLSFTITNVMGDDDEEIALVYLDTAGVDQLMETCRRWKAGAELGLTTVTDG